MLASIGRAFDRAKRWTLSLVTIAVLTGVVIAAVNVAIYFTLHQFPAWAETAEERVTREFNGRFAAQQGTFVKPWLDINNDADLHAFFVENSEHSLHGNVYEDFTLFKTTPWKGRFFNFEPSGYRHVHNQGPWPPSPEFYNIFFFGGSTTMGIGPDWATIPSYLQDRLDEALRKGKPMRVYNFGRGAYFSTQERILFQQLLLKRFIPDMVIFLDGLNDFYFIDGRPANFDYLEHAFSVGIQRNAVVERPPGRTIVDAVLDRMRLLVDRMRLLADRMRQLPMVRLAAIINDKMNPTREAALPTYKPQQATRRDLDGVVDRYIEHIRQVEGISRAYGIEPLFVFQPVPGYKYDLKYHVALNPVYGLGGHERSAQGYPVAAERRGEFGPSFLWLGDIQEKRAEALYMDAVHYNAEFSKVIADRIGAELLERERHGSRANGLPNATATGGR